MKKEVYEKPVFEIEEFETEDIIMASNELPIDPVNPSNP